MSAWKAGTVLWFDESSGEGVIVDKDGRSFYVHESALKKSSGSSGRKRVLKDSAKVKFTTYQNAYLVQVDRVKEA